MRTQYTIFTYLILYTRATSRHTLIFKLSNLKCILLSFCVVPMEIMCKIITIHICTYIYSILQCRYSWFAINFVNYSTRFPLIAQFILHTIRIQPQSLQYYQSSFLMRRSYILSPLSPLQVVLIFLINNNIIIIKENYKTEKIL